MNGPGAPAILPGRPTLRVLGTAVTLLEPIRAAAEGDLGITLDFITLDGTEAHRRAALAPRSFDIFDQWFHDLDLVWPTGSIQPIELARVRAWDAVHALPKTGRLAPDRPRAPGGDPSARLYVQLDGTLGAAPTERISLAPTVHNADGFAVVGGDASVTSWGALIDPAWSGRVVLQTDAAIGCVDLLLALRARGELQDADPGNLALGQIDALVATLGRLRRAGHFRAFWTDEAEGVAAMSAGPPVIGSLWWSGVTRLRAAGVAVRVPVPDEGYRGWFGGVGLAAHLHGRVRDAAYAYLNWWLEGPAGAIVARNGAYMATQGAVRAHLTPAEWAFWYDGAMAEAPIHDAFGREVYRAGERREGGCYAERMGRVAVWNTVMDEHNYLVRRWDGAMAG